jgi:DNA-binding transcriptional LysR family regulator
MNMINSSGKTSAKLSSVDLNLIVIIEALISEQNVSMAAKKVGLTQPAVSHALNRLRDLFGDPLFVRSAQGMTPTQKAIELAPLVKEILEKMQSLIQPVAFDPKTTQRTVRISTTDYLELTLLPPLMAHLEKWAPNLTLIFRASPSDLPKEDLENGDIDIAIAGFYGNLPNAYYQQKIFTDHLVCVARKAHPAFKNKLTLEEFLKYDHMLRSIQGDLFGVVDEALKKHKKTRRVKLGVSSFVSPAWILADTDLILAAPNRVAKKYLEYLPLKIQPCPVETKEISIYQVWHERNNKDPLNMWLRQQIAIISK